MNASGFSYTDPLRYIRKKRTTELSGVSWRLTTGHYRWRTLDRDRLTGDMETWSHPDGRWDCYEVCRPGLIERTAQEIAETFLDLSMFLEVIDRERGEAARKRAKRGSIDSWKIPIGEQAALLLTGPLTENAQQIHQVSKVVREVLELKDGGNISRTRRFRGAGAESDSGYWEGYHLDSRRCGHLHDERESALDCAHATGWRLDGTTHHWYARSASINTRLGSLGVVDPDELQKILETLGIAFTGSDDALRISNIEWDDRRFVEFRNQARWKRPARSSDGWTPPSYPVEIIISGTGRVSVQRAIRKSG